MYQHLKSGTDVRGVADERLGRAVTLTEQAVYDLSASFARFLRERRQPRAEKAPARGFVIAVGRDCRLSGGRLYARVTAALRDMGADVLDCGLASTPAMFMTTIYAGAAGAVQITASHHPADRNGLKFFTHQGGVSAAELDEILAGADRAVPAARKGTVTAFPLMQTYAQALRDMITAALPEAGCAPLRGLRLLVDAGNGVGGFYARDVLAPLGADLTGSQFLEPDGRFPNHPPNPEAPAAMASLSAAVRRHRADLGLIFDTDVDRAACVGPDGQAINRNRLIALAATVALRDCPGGTVVTDSVTSDGLRTYIEQTLGGRQYRYRRGYHNVIEKARALNQAGIDCPLAIETSGHAAFRDNAFLDDGAYLVTRLLIEAVRLRGQGRSLLSPLDALAEPADAREFRIPIRTEDFRACGARVIDSLTAAAAREGWLLAPDNREGVRVNLPACKGWFLLRLSVHDPLLPLNIESDETGGVQKILAQLLPYLAAFGELDLFCLREA